jgi:hypothetical protein
LIDTPFKGRRMVRFKKGGTIKGPYATTPAFTEKIIPVIMKYIMIACRNLPKQECGDDFS